MSTLVQTTRAGGRVAELARWSLLVRRRPAQPAPACTMFSSASGPACVPSGCQLHWLSVPSAAPRPVRSCGLLSARPTPSLCASRASSSDAESHDLMNFPRVVFPSLIKTFRRWFLVNFVIRPYLDHGFTMQGFMEGARQAILLLSERLSRGDLVELQGLVTPDALAEIQHNYTRLSLKQRADLKVDNSMIGPFMPCEVGMIIEEEGNVQKRWVEITVCAHVHPAFARSDATITQMQAEHLTVCNYRFIRDYTRGVHDTWTVNLINHFKPFTPPT